MLCWGAALGSGGMRLAGCSGHPELPRLCPPASTSSHQLGIWGRGGRFGGGRSPSMTPAWGLLGGGLPGLGAPQGLGERGGGEVEWGPCPEGAPKRSVLIVLLLLLIIIINYYYFIKVKPGFATRAEWTSRAEAVAVGLMDGDGG